MQEFLKNDYNLDALAPVRPAGDGFSMFVTPRFLPVYANGYETLSTRIAKRLMARQDLFVDVGAHFGYYSLLAAEANPIIRIIAIEPIPENAAVLRKNLEHNRVARAEVVSAAVSSRAGRVQFCKSEASDNGSLYPHPSSETLARIEVDAVCLDDLIDSRPAGRLLVKIDVDGHELEVLKGFSKTLAAGGDVAILLEMNPKMTKIAGTGARDILDHLRDEGFRLFAIDDGEGRFYPLDRAENLALMEARHEKSYYNVLCLKQDRALSALFFAHSALLGGAERSLLDLIRGLAARGVVCNAILPEPGPLRDRLVGAGCGVCVPVPHPMQTGAWWWTGTPARQAWTVAGELAADVLLPEIRRLAPDVIYSQTIVSPWGAWCAEALGMPHALSAREYGSRDHGLDFALGFTPCMEALYRSSQSVLCISAGVRDALFPEDGGRKTEVVYSHVEIPESGLSPVETGIDLEGEGVFKVGLFGTVVKAKGQADLVRACLELAQRGVRLQCVLAGTMGDPEYVAELKREIAAAGRERDFLWTGLLENPYPVMARMDAIASCAVSEALGRTWLEAAQLGRPIVYANAGGPGEVLVTGEHGLAYEPGDVAGLVDALQSVIADPTAAAARAHKAQEYVAARFGEEAYAGRIHAALARAARAERADDSMNMPVGRLLLEAGLDPAVSGCTRPKLYYADRSDEFREEGSVVWREIPFGPFTTEFKLPGAGFSLLRFDPADFGPVALALHEVTIAAEDGMPIPAEKIDIETNGEEIGQRAWKFRTADPWIVLRPGAKALKVRLVGEIRKIPVADLLAASAADRQLVARKDGELAVAHMAIEDKDWEIEGLCQIIAGKDRKIAAKDGELQRKNGELQKKDRKISGLAREVRDKDGQIQKLRRQKKELRGQLEGMQRSASWRVTAPLRLAVSAPGALRSRLAAAKSSPPPAVRPAPAGEAKAPVESAKPVPPAQPAPVVPPKKAAESARPAEVDFSLAVPLSFAAFPAADAAPAAAIVHLFYEDLAGEFRSYLKQVPGRLDVFISTCDESAKPVIEKAFAGWDKGRVDVRVAANRGRDIAPKLLQFRDVYVTHELVLHLHSKRSHHAGILSPWRHFLLENLLGSSDLAASVLHLFREYPKLGMVASQHFEPVRQYLNWGRNLPKALELAAKMDVALDKEAPLDFPSGSMFWARSAALKPLLDLELSLDDFDPECAQIDGTTAHAIERLYFYSCEKAGLDWIKIARPELFAHTPGIVRVEGESELNTFFAAHRFELLASGGVVPRQESPPAVERPAEALFDRVRDHVLGTGLAVPPALRIAIGVAPGENGAPVAARTLAAAQTALRRTGCSSDSAVYVIDASGAFPAGVSGVRRVEGGRQNPGFGAAHNRLMEVAFREGADVYVALDPDILLHPVAIAELMKMVLAGDAMVLAEAVQFAGESTKTYDPVTLDTPWVSGACLAISRLAYEAAGGFDESLDRVADVDLSWRAKANGFALKSNPRARFLRATAGRDDPAGENRRRMCAAGILLARKWAAPEFEGRMVAELQALNGSAPALHPAPVEPAWRKWADFSQGLGFADSWR